MSALKALTKFADANFLALYEKIILTYTKPHDTILIPYMHLGHFAFEAAINERLCFVYDTNPLIRVNFEAEFFYPSVMGLKNRLTEIKTKRDAFTSDKKHYFHPQTFDEVMSIRAFLESAPKDAVNLWIKRLVSEALRAPEDSNAIVEPEYIDVKQYALRTYGAIFSNIDPMKLLILYHFIPLFFNDEKEAEAELKGQKVRMAYYAPYSFDVYDYVDKNFLKMWFCEISKEQLLWYADEVNNENHMKKDFLSLHRKLESGGVIFVERAIGQDLEAFFKLAFFYGYENIQAFGTEAREFFIFRKISV
ncbi:MAG: hypothetical protein SOW25_03335 [Helicobacter sp.]|nr:hypothetical protein [Helicobacteraceae bacterium]MDY3113345.1 hypothetical protein [Helicobacter sp.]